MTEPVGKISISKIDEKHFNSLQEGLSNRRKTDPGVEWIADGVSYPSYNHFAMAESIAKVRAAKDNFKTVVDSNPTAGVKFDSDKPDMSLLSSIALFELTKVLDFGKKKYAAHNWRNGLSTCRLLAALLRHIFAYLGGESNDPESGLSHIAHAMCCCMFILELAILKPELDDRFKFKE